MKALVVGCGSIGRRHINNLLKLDKIKKIFVCSKINNCLSFFEDPDKKLTIIEDLNKAKVDFAAVCNETYRHVDTALTLAKRGIHLFIEKPLSNNLKNISLLEEIIGKNKLKLFVAYNLRFLPAIELLKEQLKAESLGNLFFANIEVGQYLPHWRANIDYRLSYSADKIKGGGVALDLSHEIDYMRYLFGEPASWKIVKTKVSRLEITSEDLFEGLYLYRSNFICRVHMDYLEPEKRRLLRIVASNGILNCDFFNKEIRITKAGVETVLKDEKYFDLDRTYVDEMSNFIECIENNSQPKVTLDDGLMALKLTEEK